MSSKKRATPIEGELVNTEKAGRGVWLVKVPRYLSETWEKNAGSEVGKLITGMGATGNDVVFKKTAGVAEGKTAEGHVPDEHRFIIRDLNNQSMAVLSEDKIGLEDESHLKTGKLNIEGRVMKRAECQPPNSLSYMKMKIKQIEHVSQPKQFVQTMEKAVVKFKPTNVHMENLAKEKAKKDGAKTVRGDRDVVMQAIFHAFEKHQYYRLSDLQRLTNQPANFVKEILMDIASYNTTQPHKSMWELKPEYRNYSTNVA